MAINLGKIKTPDFLKPVFGELLFKREPESRGMEFRVEEKALAEMRIKGLTAVGGKMLEPTIWTSTLPEVLKFRELKERERKSEAEAFKKQYPERYKEIKALSPSRMVMGQTESLIKRGLLTAEEAELFPQTELRPVISGVGWVSAKQATELIAKAAKLTRKDLIDITRGVMKDTSKIQIYKSITSTPSGKTKLAQIAKNTKIPLKTKIGNYIKDLFPQITKPTEPTKEFLLKGKPKIHKLTPAEKLTAAGKVPATTKQIAEAHIIAKSKAMISTLGKVKPQYRRLAKIATDKTSMKE